MLKPEISERPVSDRARNIRLALAERKRQGVRLGNPNPEASLIRARRIHSAAASQLAASLYPLITELQRRGFGLRAIARELNRRGVPTLRGGNWQAAQIINILKRGPPDKTGSPFYISGPAVISFSGGRTSAFMLKQIIDVHGGGLPGNVKAVFANTGKERTETLDFVQECAERWGVSIAWLEYDPDAPHKTRIVNHNTASRYGEPYEALIEKRQYLPNPVMRFCTSDLKVKRIEAYARHHAGFKRWRNVIGIRFDEPRRAEKILRKCQGCVFDCSRKGPHNELPLHCSRFIESDILTWWERQPFNLALESHEGNCDLCFLKGKKKIQALMRNRPDLAQWWMAQERRKLGTSQRTGYFRIDRPDYAALLENVTSSTDSPDGSDYEYEDCTCTD